MSQPEIYFYIHPHFWPQNSIPENADVAWTGFGFGIYTWTIQTYLRLKSDGVPCHLVSKLPEKGVLIAQRECLSAIDGAYKEKILPGPGLFVVDMPAELSLYPWANLHIVQNRFQAELFKNCYYVPLWPQPGLIPRNPSRGDRFENIAYYGNAKSLLAEFRSSQWTDELKKMGLHWLEKFQTFQFDCPGTYTLNSIWSDYSDVDAIVAVRKFHAGFSPAFQHKPASKLFNAWIAGVPAILGRESAFRRERKSHLDYLEANSIEEVLSCLKRLREDQSLRRAMVENGHIRAREIEAGATVSRWKELINSIIIPAYFVWRKKTAWQQRLEISLRPFGIFISRIRKNIWSSYASSVK